MRVYLNTSALNRPFDDQTLARVRQEAEAVLRIVEAIEAQQLELVSSAYLEFEIGQTPDPDRARRAAAPLALASALVRVTPRLAVRARDLEKFGLRGLDALHVASAEEGGVDILVTTDVRLIRRARRGGTKFAVLVVSPMEALAKLDERGR